jgi:hypothetical protein
MIWEVEYTDEFEKWWVALNEHEQTSVAVTVGLLENMGPALPFPYSSDVKSSRHGQMRELRSQCEGRPLRTLYAFDPRRVVILLIGGDKTGNDRWYESFVPIADRLYDEHLKEIERNGG